MKLLRQVLGRWQVLGAVLIALGILTASSAVPSQSECCTGDFPICCGAYCDGTQWICPGCSPIIVDTVGNGFLLTNSSDGVWFDLQGNGTQKKLSWTAAGSDDGFLFLDKNGNNQVDNGTELFGNFTSQPPSRRPNGFIALAVFDNGDEMLNALDTVYSSLRVWIDSNHDGRSEANELFTLPDVGVHSIDLNYQRHRFVDEFGNEFRYRARVRSLRSADIGKWAYDVYLVPEASASGSAGEGAVRSQPASEPEKTTSEQTATVRGQQGCLNNR